MANPLTLLSGVNPQTYAIYGGIVVVLCVTSFIGGCHYKEQSYAAKELVEVKEGARLSNKDSAAGAKSGADLATSTTQGRADTAKVLAETAGKPLTVVHITKCATPPVQVQASVAKDSTSSIPSPTQEVVPNETTQSCGPALLTFDGIRLYNLSLGAIQPSPAIPAGTTQAPDAVQVDEALREVIAPNNQQCKEVTTQLNSILDTIQEKQKLYNGKDVGVN